MTVIKNFQYKIKNPTKEQIEQFELHLDVCRQVYNYALRERIDRYEARTCDINFCSLKKCYILPPDTPKTTWVNQCNNLVEAKKTNPRLKAVVHNALQQTIRQLEKTYNAYFKKNSRYPKFKRAREFRTVTFIPPKKCLAANRVRFPKIGWVKIIQSRPYPDRFTPKQFLLTKKASGYYVTITFKSEENIPDPVPGKKSIGIDAGIESFAATPTELIKAPKFLLAAQRKLKLLQRRLKKKITGSSNWKKLQAKIAKLHETVANTRRDWHYKTANHICDRADNVFIEDIDYKSWSKGAFRKKSLDSGIGGFMNEILPYICWKRGKYYQKVNKDGTSQECSHCGEHTGKKELSERIHVCHHCGHTESRDTNSAKVIMQRGQKAIGQTIQLNIHKTYKQVEHKVRRKILADVSQFALAV